MKKLFSIMLVLVLIAIGFGCSKKSTGPSSNIDEEIVGKWYLTNYIEEGESYDMEGFVEFKSDGKMNGEFRDDEDGILVTYSGTYTTSSSTITTKVTQSSNTEWLEIDTYKWDYTITGNTLKMDEIETDEDPVHLTYSKEGSTPQEDTGSLSGTVSSNMKSEPIEGVYVEVLGTTSSGLTDEQGRYTIENIPVGSYSVKFTKTGYEEYLQNNVQISKNNTTTLNVSMTMLTSGYGEVSGYVLDAMEQTPLAGATITIENTAFTTTTNESGIYSISDIPVGTYTITASKEGYDSQSNTIQVLANQEISSDFILLPEGSNTFGTISGTVTNQNGQPVKNVLIQLVGFYNQALTDENGNYQLVAVQEGSYTITFSKTGYETHTEENYSITAGEDKILNVTINQIEGVGNLSCYVQNVLELPINGALVEILDTQFSATTNLAGTCQIQNIPTGIYSVRVSKSGYQTEVIEHVEIITGVPTQVLNVTLRN